MDYTAKNHIPENLPSDRHEHMQHKPEAKEHLKPSKEVKDAAIGKAAYLEAVGMNESVETVGKVSEILSKTKENDTAGASGSVAAAKKQTLDPALIQQNLLKNLPSEAVMKRQIEKEIKKEVDYLHKKAMKMLRSPGKMSYFEMSNLMRKIRELKGILFGLVKASLETLKTLWLRYVHGIM